jgi:hypothetical protein
VGDIGGFGAFGLDLFVVDVSVCSFCSTFKINELEMGVLQVLDYVWNNLGGLGACSMCSSRFFELEHCEVKVKRVRHG